MCECVRALMHECVYESVREMYLVVRRKKITDTLQQRGRGDRFGSL